MEFNDYIAHATGLTHRQIALKAGMQPSKLSRQLSGHNALSMETVRDIARGTGLDMLELLQKSGHITELEMLRLRRAANLSEATDEDLAGEILRRMQKGHTAIDGLSPFDTRDGFMKAAERDNQPDLDESDLV